MSALPQAVTEHLRVLGAQSNTVIFQAVRKGESWVRLTGAPDFSDERARMFRGMGVTRVELRFDSWVSEFEIEELVS